MKACYLVLDGFLETIIEEHVRNAKELQGQHMDFIDVMLSLMESNNTRELHLHRDHIKAIVLDIFFAAMDTSSTAIEWVIAEFLKNPRVMKLVQEELENVIGLVKMVEETDLIKLSYLKMVIMESLRIHPVGPLLLPHESTEDITINGYFIPKKSRVLINTWAIGRDPNVWSSNAEEFYPE
ncbi:Cytochrome p450, partial [Thalictrum thalictroides]